MSQNEIEKEKKFVALVAAGPPSDREGFNGVLAAIQNRNKKRKQQMWQSLAAGILLCVGLGLSTGIFTDRNYPAVSTAPQVASSEEVYTELEDLSGYLKGTSIDSDIREYELAQ